MDIGAFLKSKRNQANLSLSQVGDILGYSSQAVYSWESNKALPELAVWSKYANILGLDLESFLRCQDSKLNNRCEELKFDSDKFVNSLVFARKTRHLTQKDVAKKLRINHKTVSSWERGVTSPSMKNFLVLCEIYKTSIDSLYFAIPEQNSSKKTKKRRFLPIFLPIIIVVGAGGGTATAIGVSEYKKKQVALNNSVQNATQLSENSVPSSLPNSVPSVTSDQPLVTSSIQTNSSGASLPSASSSVIPSSSSVEPIIQHDVQDYWSFDDTNHWHACNDCDELFDVSNHVLSTVIDNPTYESSGSKTESCIYCDYEKVTILPQLEHNYSENYSYDNFSHWRECIDAGYSHLQTDYAAHSFSCDDNGNGILTYTCICGYSYIDDTSSDEDDVSFINVEDESKDYTVSLLSEEKFIINLLNVNNLEISQIKIREQFPPSTQKFDANAYINSGSYVKLYEDGEYSKLYFNVNRLKNSYSWIGPCTYRISIVGVILGSDYGNTEITFPENAVDFTITE